MNRRRFLFLSGAALIGAVSPSVVSAALSDRRRTGPAWVGLIIDDIGYSRRRAKRFLDLPVPITYSVLPRLALSRPLAVEIHEAGHQLLLHQPMEPVDSRFDPGPGALFVRQDGQRAVEILEENLEDVAFAAGVNNHMGSLFTASAHRMRPVLECLKGRERFFVDSVTSRRSAGFQTAMVLNLPCTRRHVFLDNVRSEAAVFDQLRRLARRARAAGCAVGIGHPFPETASAIDRFISSPAAADVEPVYVSSLLEGPCLPQDSPSSSLISSVSRRIRQAPLSSASP